MTSYTQPQFYNYTVILLMRENINDSQYLDIWWENFDEWPAKRQIHQYSPPFNKWYLLDTIW